VIVTDPHVKPLRIEVDAAERTVVHLRQVVRDSGGNVVRDEIVRHVHLVEDEPGASLTSEKPRS
jgi:hypothetical protein